MCFCRGGVGGGNGVILEREIVELQLWNKERRNLVGKGFVWEAMLQKLRLDTGGNSRHGLQEQASRATFGFWIFVKKIFFWKISTFKFYFEESSKAGSWELPLKINGGEKKNSNNTVESANPPYG